jgi:hypothetical protein
MRIPFAMKSVAAAFAATALVWGAPAQADEQFDVAVTGDGATVTTKGEWHINKEFPWKAKGGDKTVSKDAFSLAEKTATVKGLPKGKVTITGGVCAKDNCIRFTKDVEVK